MQHDDHGHQASHKMTDGPAPGLPTGAIRATDPICGMTTLPVEEPSPELPDFTRRMWISAAAAIPRGILTMRGPIRLPVRDRIGQNGASWLEFLLAAPAVPWEALPFIRRRRDSLVNRSPSMWMLIAPGLARREATGFSAITGNGVRGEVDGRAAALGNAALISAVLLAALVAAQPAGAQQSPEFPKSASFIIRLTSSQYASGLGEYLVPPLDKAFRNTGMRYDGGPGADFAATVETGADVGKWYGEGDAAEWLYERFVTIGLTPADVDVEPEGRLSPRFSVTVTLITPNEDRVDELNCLIALATRELSFRYRPAGHVAVDGKTCARKQSDARPLSFLRSAA